jgi:hypothetical protein
MKCNDVMTFLSQISAKSITASISDEDLNFLISNGCIGCLSKDEYKKLLDSVADLSKVTGELEELHTKEKTDEETFEQEEKKIHSIRFWFEAREKKEADRERAQEEDQLVSKDEETIHEKDAELQSLIRKKSTLDRQVLHGERYLSLTGAGVVMLHDLSIRNYRVGDTDFKTFIQETKATKMELQAIAERAANYYQAIETAIANLDTSPLAKESYEEDEDYDEDEYRIKSKGVESSQLWAVSIGLAKLEGDPEKIKESFIQIINTLKGFNKSNLDSKLMAAETLLAAGHAEDMSQNTNVLTTTDRQIRQSANVPEEISAGVTTTLFCGSNPGALTRFDEFLKITKSNTAAAVLSGSQETVEELSQKFESFKTIFDSWGYSPSEDTDLAAAYLAISPPNKEDESMPGKFRYGTQEKMKEILDAIKADFEFPLVPAAILTSIQALSANELLDLMEKAVTILQSQEVSIGEKVSVPLASELSHSELASLAIRMIYGQ